MLKTVYWYSHFMLTAMASYPKLRKVKKLVATNQLEEATLYAHTVTSKWAMKQIKSAGATIHVHGLENIPQDEPVVFISNHQGNFDIAIFMAYIDKPKGYVAKIETLKIPVVRTWMTYIHCVFMDRSSLKTAATAIIEGIKSIKEGHSLVIFPEGTRSRSNQIGDFKGGSFKLATKSKAPIVPVTIDGSYKLMEGNGGKVRSGVVNVYIHPPVQTKDLTKEEATALPETIKQMIASKLPH